MSAFSKTDYFSLISSEISAGRLSGEIIHHPETDGAKSEDAAKALGTSPDSILKSLLLVPEKKEGGVPIVAILLGNSKLNLKTFPNHRLARREELPEILGAGIGEIPPVLLPVPVVVDEGVFQRGFVFGSAGTKFSGLKIAPEEILKANKTAKRAKISAT